MKHLMHFKHRPSDKLWTRFGPPWTSSRKPWFSPLPELRGLATSDAITLSVPTRSRTSLSGTLVRTCLSCSVIQTIKDWFKPTQPLFNKRVEARAVITRPVMTGESVLSDYRSSHLCQRRCTSLLRAALPWLPRHLFYRSNPSDSIY